MLRQRPTAVLVMAILNFVFGGIAILGSLCGGTVYVVMINLPEPAQGQPDPFPNALKFLAKEIPGYTAYMTANLVQGTMMATALVVAGVGLLRMRPWARWTCVIYAALQVLVQVGNLCYTILYVNPVMERWMQDLARKLPPGTPNLGANSFLNNMGTFLGVALGVAYAIALLVVMFLPSVSAAFAGKAARPVEQEQDYYDATSEEDAPQDR